MVITRGTGSANTSDGHTLRRRVPHARPPIDRYGDGVSATGDERVLRAPRDEHGHGSPWWDVATWGCLLVVVAGLTIILRRSWTGNLDDGAPFGGQWRLHVAPATGVAALIAVLVVAAGLRGLPERWRFSTVLFAAYGVGLAWTYSLALTDGLAGLSGPVDHRGGLQETVRGIGSNPGAYLASIGTAGSDAPVSPPGATMFVWALHRLGFDNSAAVGGLLAAIGCLTVPFVLIAVRSLCHEPAARRLAPVLALAPYAVWVAVSADALALALAAAAVACGTVGSEPRRSPWWAAAAGLLLGLASLVSYVAWLLAAAVVITYFVRRRPLPNLITGAAFLLPLFAAEAAGLAWSAGFAAARGELIAANVHRQPVIAWMLVDLLVVVVVSGPLVIASARKIRRTPGWPFLVGAALGLTFAVVSGLARGEVGRLLLPFLPWLLVAGVAPERRPTTEEPVERTAAVFPAVLTAVGAVAALTWQSAIASQW